MTTQVQAGLRFVTGLLGEGAAAGLSTSFASLIGAVSLVALQHHPDLLEDTAAHAQLVLDGIRTLGHVAYDQWARKWEIANTPPDVQDIAFEANVYAATGRDTGLAEGDVAVLKAWAQPQSFADPRFDTVHGASQLCADYQDHVALQMLGDLQNDLYATNERYNQFFRWYIQEMLVHWTGRKNAGDYEQRKYAQMYLELTEEQQGYIRSVMQPHADGDVDRAALFANVETGAQDQQLVETIVNRFPTPEDVFHDAADTPDPVPLAEPMQQQRQQFQGTATNTSTNGQCPVPPRRQAGNTTGDRPPPRDNTTDDGESPPNNTTATTADPTQRLVDNGHRIIGAVAVAGVAAYGARRLYRNAAGAFLSRPINYPADVAHALQNRRGPFSTAGRQVQFATDEQRQRADRLQRVQWAADALALPRDSVAAAACLVRWSAALKDREDADWALALRMAFALCDDDRMRYPSRVKNMAEQHTLSFGLLARAVCARFSLPEACMRKACVQLNPGNFVMKSYRVKLPATTRVAQSSRADTDALCELVATQNPTEQFSKAKWSTYTLAGPHHGFLCEYAIRLRDAKPWLLVSKETGGPVTPSRVIAATDETPRSRNTDVHVYTLCGVVMRRRSGLTKTLRGISEDEVQVHCVTQDGWWHKVYPQRAEIRRRFHELFNPDYPYTTEDMVFRRVETMLLNMPPAASHGTQSRSTCRVLV